MLPFASKSLPRSASGCARSSSTPRVLSQSSNINTNIHSNHHISNSSPLVHGSSLSNSSFQLLHNHIDTAHKYHHSLMKKHFSSSSASASASATSSSSSSASSAAPKPKIRVKDLDWSRPFSPLNPIDVKNLDLPISPDDPDFNPNELTLDNVDFGDIDVSQVAWRPNWKNHVFKQLRGTMHKLIALKRLEDAEEIFHVILPVEEIDGWETIIEEFAARAQFDKAHFYFTWMKKYYPLASRPSLRSYLKAAYLSDNINNMNLVMDAWRRQVGLPPDVEAYNTFLRYYRHAKLPVEQRIEMVKKYYAEMYACDCPPDADTFSIMSEFWLSNSLSFEDSMVTDMFNHFVRFNVTPKVAFVKFILAAFNNDSMKIFDKLSELKYQLKEPQSFSFMFAFATLKAPIPALTFTARIMQSSSVSYRTVEQLLSALQNEPRLEDLVASFLKKHNLCFCSVAVL